MSFNSWYGVGYVAGYDRQYTSINNQSIYLNNISYDNPYGNDYSQRVSIDIEVRYIADFVLSDFKKYVESYKSFGGTGYYAPVEKMIDRVIEKIVEVEKIVEIPINNLEFVSGQRDWLIALRDSIDLVLDGKVGTVNFQNKSGNRKTIEVKIE